MGSYDARLGDINANIQNTATRPDEMPVMVYALWNMLPSRVASKIETGTATPADLEGRTLGGAQGASTTRLFTVLGRVNGVILTALIADGMTAPQALKERRFLLGRTFSDSRDSVKM
ncbi:MAG: hypothetical protein DI616_02270 [Paracoccus denitrificans]|uniref:Uncharacterized protein n=1 Tax=Paracoccus denitrificans TaxID=266 RepID=A0A533IBH9_PARDE|nr:MAG: hypothetical protein DI616_02270 [Paracoccus denitrificans]